MSVIMNGLIVLTDDDSKDTRNKIEDAFPGASFCTNKNCIEIHFEMDNFNERDAIDALDEVKSNILYVTLEFIASDFSKLWRITRLNDEWYREEGRIEFMRDTAQKLKPQRFSKQQQHC